MNSGSPGQSGLTLVVYAALILAILAGSVIVITQQPATAVISIIPPPPTPTPSPITVYVSGAVGQPGVFVLPTTSRVEDAIRAAGGTAANADLNRVNLAAPVRDGDQVHVPVAGEPDLVLATPSGGERVAINSATLEALDALPGIGPALAQRIVEYRSLNGGIADLDELGDIEGFGAALLETLAPLIRFD